MRTVTTPAEMRTWSDERRRSGRRIGLVPTMGALHEGHLALVASAAERCDDVVVSIFVNPLQFNEPADFASYPRPIDDDLRVCTDAGVAAVYAPTAAVMYPTGHRTTVVVEGLTEPMEGAMRPGHFDGVTTVVAKLLAAVTPHEAVFGEKDFQQLAIVRRMVTDLDLGVDIVGHPIVREHDGLALSSRNRRLDEPGRAAAVIVPRAIDAAVDRAHDPAATVDDVVAAAHDVFATEPRARPEYVTVFDPVTLAPADGGARADDASTRIAVAVWVDDVRLIDNRALR